MRVALLAVAWMGLPSDRHPAVEPAAAVEPDEIVVEPEAVIAPAVWRLVPAPPPRESGISGMVIDWNGSPVAYARVVCASTELLRTVVADQAGQFAFELPPGNYQLTVSGRTVVIPVDPGERLDGIELEIEPQFEFTSGNFF